MSLLEFPVDVSKDDAIPWANDYIDQGGMPNSTTLVCHVRRSAKGIIVIGEDFKGFLFKGSSIHDFLLEALEAWITNGTVNYPLFAIALDNGKINLAVDDELEPTIWKVLTKGKHWEQKEKKKKGDGSNHLRLNPFLPVPPPTSGNTRKRNTNSTVEPPTTIGH